MFLKQGEIFWGMSHDFVKEVMKHAKKRTHDAGDVIFREGDQADLFYIMLKGSVKLNVGETGQAVHIVSHAGESFGWSSLIDRDAYSATAECLKPTELMVLEREHFRAVLKKDPANGLIFTRRLAGVIASRLINSYKIIASAAMAEEFATLGTGQVSETLEEA